MMKALTVYQPHASLIELNEKKYETRSWATSYRGPIAIHAAKKPFSTDSYLDRELYPFAEGLKLPDIHSFDTFPHGCIIAIAELVNVWYIVAHPGTNVDIAKHIPIGAESMTTNKHAPDFADYIVPTELEMLYGDWTPGRYAWQLQNVHRIKTPILAKGRQRLWNWDESEHLVSIDPWVIGSTKIWTPQGLRSGRKLERLDEDAVLGLEVA